MTTIGAYDGVHRGHREVIRQVRQLAEERGLQSAVVTFDRHPASVVRPESAPLLLTDLDQKLELLRSTGVDVVVVIHFDEARSRETAAEFVLDTLVDDGWRAGRPPLARALAMPRIFKRLAKMAQHSYWRCLRTLQRLSERGVQ